MALETILRQEAIDAAADEWDMGACDLADRYEVVSGVLSALTKAGWSIVPPANYEGVCPRCRCFIEPGTHHEMFNGNQMFACSVVGALPGDEAR